MSGIPQPPSAPPPSGSRESSDISDLAAAVDSRSQVVAVRRHYVRAHRGTAVLVLGILGLVICFICGIIAWTMANNDLKEMTAGRMDRSGQGITRAGKICGIIGVVIACVQLTVVLFALASHVE